MEYERINDKPQNGIISPSKLRMKLMGISPKKRKEGSNCNSSRTSPARVEDSDFVKSSLLASNNQDFDDSASSAGPVAVKSCGQTVPTSLQKQSHWPQKENNNTDGIHVKVQQSSSRGDSSNSSAVHPLKSYEDDNLDYDSNASSSSFEFHKGERMGAHRSLTRSLSRPTSYKWNDAEKWIMNKQAVQASYSNKNHVVPGFNTVRVAPEASGYEYRPPLRVPDTKRIDLCQSTAHNNFERFNPGAEPALGQSNGVNVQIDLYPRNKDLREVGNPKNFPDDVAGTPAIRAISMMDMGTEMTPVPSQEPSRTATPVGATTPLRSPTSSIPSTPRRGAESPVEFTTDSNPRNQTHKGDKELSEQELKLKTRREIVALGVQLGKMSIAAWASKDEKEKEHENSPSPKQVPDMEEHERIEFEKRAAAWEEAEKSKHAASYKREEIKIQAWESQQKAKLEEELRRIEAKVEQLRSKFQAKMVKRIALARKRSEEKRAAAEARKKREAEKTAAQAEYIRQTGRVPSSEFVCCGLFS